MPSDYISGLQGTTIDRYKRKLALCCLEDCPYRLPADVWKNDPSEWPPVDFGTIYVYLIDTPGVHTREAMKNYKGLASYKLLVSGWVQTVMHMTPSSSNTMVFRADVTPSFRVNEQPHHPWAAVNPGGDIIAAHCDCKAGLGESCSHIGGLLYKVEMVVRAGGGRKAACTDVLCTWNEANMKGVAAARIADIDFYSDKPKQTIKTNNAPARRADLQPATPEEQEEFLVSLLAASNPVLPIGLSLFSSTLCNFAPKNKPIASRRLIPGLRSLFRPNVDTSPQSLDAVVKELIEKVNISSDAVQHVQEVTRLQSESLLWFEQRAGRITSSNAHAALHTNPNQPAPSLIKIICNDKPNHLKTPPIAWGRQHETVARQQYAEGVLSVEHEDVTVKDCGLIISQEFPFLAASPDGLLSCSCHGLGVLEIKCPFKFRDMTVTEMSKNKDSCLDENLHLKVSHAYYSQVQHQMFVTGATFCDFVVWLPSGGHVCTVFVDAGYRATSLPCLEALWKTHVIRELVTRDLELCTKRQQVPSEDHHCSCGGADSIPMIGCDRTGCPHQWYHWACVGITKEPRAAKWYCDVCKGTNKRKRQRRQ